MATIKTTFKLDFSQMEEALEKARIAFYELNRAFEKIKKAEVTINRSNDSINKELPRPVTILHCVKSKLKR